MTARLTHGGRHFQAMAYHDALQGDTWAVELAELVDGELSAPPADLSTTTFVVRAFRTPRQPMYSTVARLFDGTLRTGVEGADVMVDFSDGLAANRKRRTDEVAKEAELQRLARLAADLPLQVCRELDRLEVPPLHIAELASLQLRKYAHNGLLKKLGLTTDSPTALTYTLTDRLAWPLYQYNDDTRDSRTHREAGVALTTAGHLICCTLTTSTGHRTDPEDTDHILDGYEIGSVFLTEETDRTVGIGIGNVSTRNDLDEYSFTIDYSWYNLDGGDSTTWNAMQMFTDTIEAYTDDREYHLR
ncbi:hypothetical protein R8Z50_11045 [Longispora sp. K20-0274]|uniref:hypothetical protein n=1 Tax=Longispora sp. K20-0274 TaxID=3088255 RepID=UPI00399C1848